MANLEHLLRVLPGLLRPGGRAAIISFHSGEDRQVKTAFRTGRAAGVYDAISAEPIRPTFGERTANPRSRSAKLRLRRGVPAHETERTVMNSFVTHLESALDGTRFPAGQVHTVHQGRPLWVRYDLAAVRAAVTPEQIDRRAPNLWRYRELLPLPLDAEPVTLGEGMTPLLALPAPGQALGLSRLFIKDESQLPTGSFKSRGMTVAVSMAKHFGLQRLAIPTAGNAGGALAAYGARAGMEVYVFMPEDTPVINQHRGAPGRRQGVPGQRPDHRLRPAGARGRGSAWAGSTCPRSRSRTASKARRRWAWSWPSRPAGGCRT